MNRGDPNLVLTIGPGALPPEPALVTVVIVSYNSGPILQRSLEAMAAQSERRFRAVVVDNDSSDGWAASLRLPDARFVLVCSRRNLGFAAGVNLGAALIPSPWVATLNPDALPDKNWLAELLAVARAHPQAAAVGSLQVFMSDPKIIDGAGDCYHFSGTAWRGGHGQPLGSLPKVAEVFSPCAAAALYDGAAFREIGGMYERLFCYMEDVDLGFRLRLTGRVCLQANRARVLHQGDVSGAGASGLARRLGFRNRLWVLARDMPGLLLWLAWPWWLLAQVVLLLQAAGQGQGAQAWQGLSEGVRGLGKVWAQRRAVQASRTVSLTRLVQAMTWSPLAALRRDTCFRRRFPKA
ncbi:MAG: glycosyltransferase family 2 protein [Deltaproteobacteria bacterium]|nr:glycosyltransferase family 2 protein [Deltaproteobacteria bacterium]